MQFHEYPLLYHAARAKGLLPPRESLIDFYARLLARYNPHMVNGLLGPGKEYAGDEMGFARFTGELGWSAVKRPFYNVWPKIIPLLTRLDLSQITGELVKPPKPTLLLRFPKLGNPLVFDGIELRSLLLTWVYASKYQSNGLYLIMDVGELNDGLPMMTLKWFPLVPGEALAVTLADADMLPSMERGWKIPVQLIDTAIRLSCTLLLLEHDSEIIDRIVLNADREAYERTGELKYVEKAERTGVIGWDVGRHVEVMPHFRRPHFGLRWTGEGRKIPKIVAIRGSLIHREAVTEIPTGFQDPPVELPGPGSAPAAADRLEQTPSEPL